MNPPPSLLAAAITMPDISPYLTKGADAGSGVTLHVGDPYVWGLLGGGPLLILAGVVLIKIMFGRVKFFALEFGNDGFFGRSKVIAPFIVLGSLLFLAGAGGTWLGWQAQGYSVTMNANGVTENARGDTLRYAWDDVSGRAEHIKSTDFWLAFSKDGHRCRLRFQQRYIGEKLQDKAIAIAENSLSFTSPRR